MPIFDYQCRECDFVEEVIQKHIDAQERKCPRCGGEMTKLIGPSSFVLKGSGWYKTDYADTKKSKSG